MAAPALGTVHARLVEQLDTLDGPLLIAMSAGVDSCTLAGIAHELLGERVLAVTLDTESTPREELEDARAFAASIGLPHRVVEHSELADPAYVRNAGDRCFHCRKGMAEALTALAAEEGFATILMGVVPDDLGEHRPGIEAARAAGIRFPLVDADVSKAAVRALAAERGWPVADRPSNACLSSRIAFGQEVTREKLRQVEEAERAVRERTGARQVRVRHHGAIARIEVAPEERASVLAHADELTSALQGLGFTFVSLDLVGYRSGAMVALLDEL